MNNIKIINKSNLLHNLKIVQKCNKNICVMVKADAYGHNYKTIINELKNKVQWFGVANEQEALNVKKIVPYSNVLIVGKLTDYYRIIKNNISFTIDSLNELNKVLEVCKKNNFSAKIHIAINTGMNRIGLKSIKEFKSLLSIFEQNEKHIILEGIFTHCYDADCKNTYFYEQMEDFYQYVKMIKNKNVLVHIGGSYVLQHKLPEYINMVRIGYFIYGYGKTGLKPVMQINSKIIKIIYCKKGEYVGYGNKTKLTKDTTIAIVPIGYADGLSRNLSNNKYSMKINNENAYVVGNICMDMCMLDVTNLFAKVGDEVICYNNAKTIAKIVNTSPYEILTNFQKLRGKTVVK